MDRLDAMAVLLAVADAGSLSGASRALGIPLTTISRKITDLESHVGAQLLDRSARNVSLTDAGQAFVLASKAILRDMEDAERAAAGEYKAPRGTVTVGVPAAFGRLHLLPVLSDFILAYPEIDVRMIPAEKPAEMLESIVDVAVRIGEGDGPISNVEPLGKVRKVVCGSPGYITNWGLPSHPLELRAHACVTFGDPSSDVTWTFQTREGGLVVPIHSRLAVTTLDAAIDAAIGGVGLTNVWSYAVSSYERDGLLQIVLAEFEPNSETVYLVYRASYRLPLKLRALVDFCVPRLRERLTVESRQERDHPHHRVNPCED